MMELPEEEELVGELGPAAASVMVSVCVQDSTVDNVWVWVPVSIVVVLVSVVLVLVSMVVVLVSIVLVLVSMV